MIRNLLLCILLVWAFQKVDAAAIPATNMALQAPAKMSLPDIIQHKPVPSHIKKQSFIKRFEIRLLQKKLKDVRSGSKNTWSTLAVIFALLGISGFIIPSLAMVLIFGISAFIAGIVALSKKELSRTTKTKAIFGIAIGALLTGIGILAALLISLNNSIQ